MLLGTPGFYATAGALAVAAPRLTDRRAVLAVQGGDLSVLRSPVSAASSPPRNLYAPIFADGTDSYAPGKPPNPSNPWARFVWRTVSEFKDHIKHWEIWNEPDFSLFWSGSVADYVRLLKVGALAARAADPQARILVGQRTPIRVVDLGAIGAPGGQAPRATAQLVETGIKLEVTPHITADRRILLQLQAENSDARPVAGEFGVVFDTQEGRTRLLVDDGETAVIGGLTVTRISETRQGIPLLMDIPILGALFRTTSRQEIKQDLLILVTPRIVES